jgi:VanZ family protein
VIGALLSAAVEAAQLFSQRRMASVLDVGTNTAGAFAGALVVALGVAAARARRPVPLAPAPMAVVALPYVAACLLEAFSAFGRPDAVPGASGGPGARWAAAFAQLRTHPGALPGAQAAAWTDALLFAPAGAFVVLLWAERGGRPRAGAVAAAAALALAWAFAELLRGVSGGDMAPAAVAVRTLASAATAAAVAAALGGAGPARVRALVARGGAAAYAALLLAWSWQPFAPVGSLAEVVERLGGRAWVPLAALADAYTLHSVADVGVGSLLYVPVGAWLAVRGGGRLRTLWPGIALAAAAEGGQAAVAARTFDVTDLLVQAAGVFLGWAVVRQADVLRAAGRPAVRSARDDDGAADPSADRPAAPPAATSPAPA